MLTYAHVNLGYESVTQIKLWIYNLFGSLV